MREREEKVRKKFEKLLGQDWWRGLQSSLFLVSCILSHVDEACCIFVLFSCFYFFFWLVIILGGAARKKIVGVVWLAFFVGCMGEYTEYLMLMFLVNCIDEHSVLIS